MTNKEIRAIALEVARELLDEPLNIGQAEHYADFATHFLAAINSKAEPHSYMVNGEWMKKLPPPPFVNGGTRVVELFTNPAIEEINTWSVRELELFDGMIEVQKTHAETCDRIPNRVMAEKQKGWDLERVALLEKCKALYQKG